MSSTFTFGSYVAGTSALHRLDPRTKLLLGVAFLVLVLQARDFTGLLPSLVAIVSLYACARITPTRGTAGPRANAGHRRARLPAQALHAARAAPRS